MFGVAVAGFLDFVGDFVGRRVLHPPPTEITPDLSSACAKNLFWYKITLPTATDQLLGGKGGGAYERSPDVRLKRLR